MKPTTSDSWRPLALLLVGVAIPCAILIRLIPYEYRMPNLALNGALFLFAGARLGPWPWRVLPFIATAVVDLYFVGIKYGGPSPLIYASYGLYLLLALATGALGIALANWCRYLGRQCAVLPHLEL